MKTALQAHAASIRHAGYTVSPINFLYNVDVEDLDIFFRPLLVSPGILDLVYHIQPLHSATKNSVLVVKPWLLILSAKCNP